MKQYIDLLHAIIDRGTFKPAARENMPGSQSLFGYQFRHDLAEGFPVLTTKRIFWKGVVIELLWFLRGDTNIKYLVDNGVNIWNGDAYNYYLKNYTGSDPMSFERFIERIKETSEDVFKSEKGLGLYQLGDCGFQYGRVWRNWQGEGDLKMEGNQFFVEFPQIDQFKNLIQSLMETPESRRHMITALDPAHDKDLALFWCHSMMQFNCRPISLMDRVVIWEEQNTDTIAMNDYNSEFLNQAGVPEYYLDCHLYQRSADTVLGVPFNIASYALLTHIVSGLVNMVPGEFIHSFGDVHIYDNHADAVEEQLHRTPGKLPILKINPMGFYEFGISGDLDKVINNFTLSDFVLEGYNPAASIKAELSTG